MKTKRIIWTGRSGVERALYLPCKNVVCYRCDGTGAHVNPAIDGHGLTQEDFDQDPDFKEGYFSGRYDVRCEVCGGQNVISVVDEERLNKRQKLIYEDWLRQERDHAAEVASEREWGY